MLIQHLTIATGHSVPQDLTTLSPEAVAACRDLLPHGGPIPAFTAFRVQIRGHSFSIHRSTDHLLTAFLGIGSTHPTPEQHARQHAYWQEILQLQRQILPQLRPPAMPAGPWLAIVLGAGIVTQNQDNIRWLGDFERCMAADILLPPTPDTPQPHPSPDHGT